MADLIEMIGTGPSVTLQDVGDALEIRVSSQVITTLSTSHA